MLPDHYNSSQVFNRKNIQAHEVARNMFYVLSFIPEDLYFFIYSINVSWLELPPSLLVMSLLSTPCTKNTGENTIAPTSLDLL